MIKTKLNLHLVALFAISLTISGVIAQEHGKGPGKGREKPQLTEEQKTCLEGKIGVPGGDKPTRESMTAAFAECGVEKPKGPPAGNRARPQNDNQQAANTETE